LNSNNILTIAAMELNEYIFPVPPPSYTVSSLNKLLFYVPQKGDFRNYKYDIIKSKKQKLPNTYIKQIEQIEQSIEIEQIECSDNFDSPKADGYNGCSLNRDTEVSKCDTDLVERSRRTKISVPNFMKQRSHLKNIHRNENSDSFGTPFYKENNT
jgi:hypothetical protein